MLLQSVSLVSNMINLEDSIKSIINAGLLAPSFYNTQPWQFKVSNNKIELFLAESELSIYDWHKIQSLLSVGAVIENIVNEAKKWNLTCDYQVNDQFSITEPVVIIKFLENLTEDSRLNIKLEAIKNRHANYYMFENESLEQVQLSYFNKLNKPPGIQLKIISDEQSKKIIFNVASIIDQIRFMRKDLHFAFYNKLHFSEKKHRKIRTGFNLENLGICGFASYFFRITKYWYVTKFLRNFGLAKKFGENANLGFLNCSALGLISVENLDTLTLIRAGQFMQQLWLETTILNYGLQPHTTLCVFDYLERLGNGSELSDSELKLINENINNYRELFNLNSKNIGVFLFRLGKITTPIISKTLRKELKQVILS
ncbi:MAG: hypothetical protein KDD58_04565 [Bdellovibrionales bacterium]|nr:hypothetical protein [Bdellovibrionales bacterium]